jgi:hypothetical protein
MTIPAVVLDTLNSLKIVSLPAQVNPGDRVDLGLSPGLDAFNVLSQPLKLFDIELNDITLDDLGINLTDINLAPVSSSPPAELQLTLNADLTDSSPGTTDLKVVSKAVEFDEDPSTGTTAQNIDTNQASLHALPHLIPEGGLPPVPSTDVEGLLSRVSGTVKPVERFTGDITGNVIGNIGGHITGRITGTIKNLKGSVTGPKLLETPLSRPDVEWYVEDENGKRLEEHVDFLMLNKTLADPSPSVLFMPVFTELSAGVDLISRRRIFCKVTVKVSGEPDVVRLLGPVDILLPKIQLPTVLVMNEHAVTGVGYPGAVLIAVPSQSLLKLDQLTEKLQAVKVVLARLQTVAQFVGFVDTIEQIDRIIGLIGNPSSRAPTFVVRDQVMDLWYVMREPGGFLGIGYKSWEDCISSLIMIGPPGRTARFHNGKNLWERAGAFEIILGAKAVGFIDNLTGKNPECKPTGDGGCVFHHRWDPPPSSYNDIISSYQLMPLQ